MKTEHHPSKEAGRFTYVEGFQGEEYKPVQFGHTTSGEVGQYTGSADLTASDLCVGMSLISGLRNVQSLSVNTYRNTTRYGNSSSNIKSKYVIRIVNFGLNL